MISFGRYKNTLGLYGHDLDVLITFRKCEECGQRNLVKDDWFFCAVCNADLLENLNFLPNLLSSLCSLLD